MPSLASTSREYARTGFTGALQGYRVRRGNDPRTLAELRTFAGRTVDVPICFIAGKSDWGSYKTPGELEAMQGPVSHQMARHAFRRRRRPLGAAGAAGSDGEAAHRLLRRPAVTMRRRAFLFLLAGAAAAVRSSRQRRGARLSGAADHHDRAVPAGGPNDTLGRIMAERMRTSLGQPVIVENVSGAERHHRRRPRRARGARRLHHRHRHLEHACRQPGDLFAALRHR